MSSWHTCITLSEIVPTRTKATISPRSSRNCVSSPTENRLMHGQKEISNRVKRFRRVMIQLRRTYAESFTPSLRKFNEHLLEVGRLDAHVPDDRPVLLQGLQHRMQ